MVAVLIGNTRNTRGSELGYNAAFVEFLSQEVLPWVPPAPAGHVR